MSDRVSVARPAAIAAVLAGIFVAVLFVVRPVSDGLVGLFGGPTGLERSGGVRVRYRPPAGVSSAELARSTGSVESRDGDVLVLDYPGVAEGAVPELVEVLRGGGLSMVEVLHTPYAREIDALVAGGATVEIDTWVDEVTGKRQLLDYLRAPSRAQLERTLEAAAVAGWRPPPGAWIGLEEVAWHHRGESEILWRTYLLSAEAVIDGTMIERALVSFDPYTNRPIVLLDFTRDGAARFCDVTKQLVGRKLAIVLGDRIRSAPVINSAICGGRASITMGGESPVAQEREAHMLASVLSRRPLPPGGTVESARWQAAADAGLEEWLGRLLLGLGAGVLAGGLAALVIRVARPRRALAPERAPAADAGPFPLRRLAITLLAPVALYLGGTLALPGLNEIELEHITARAGGAGPAFSVVALGVMPILTAFFAVEVLALAVPWLRWRRHDPRGRVRLGQAVAALAIALALAQGYFAALYLESLSLGGAEVIASPGLTFRLLVMTSLAAGTMLLGALAGLIREHGLGNGYGALIVGGALVDLARPRLEGPGSLADLLDGGHALGLAALAVIVSLTAASLRWRIADEGTTDGDPRAPALRVPASGVAVLGDGGGFAFLLVLLAGVGLGPLLVDPMQWMIELEANRWIPIGLVVVLAVAYAWLFARPSLLAPVAARAGLPPPAMSAWRRAALASAALLLAVHVIDHLASTAGAAMLASPAIAMAGTAVVLDAIADARAHRRRLAPAGVLHQIQHAGSVERVLADAGIPCHLHASHLRTLAAFFGPWAPVIVLVPEAQAAEARQLLTGLVAAASGRDAPAAPE
jgi:hypothetical protein